MAFRKRFSEKNSYIDYALLAEHIVIWVVLQTMNCTY